MKKILTFMLGICLIVPCMFMFSACGKKDPEATIETWDGSTATVSAADTQGVITIETAEELAGLAAAVNAGETFEGKTIKLTCDMDMANKAWTPIGVGNRSDLANAKMFKGTFDGNGKKIIGLTNKGYVPTSKTVESDFVSAIVETYHYGFFGVTENAEIKNITLTVSFDCDEDNLKADGVGGLVGYANGGLKVSGCVVNGKVEGYDAVAGIVGRAYDSTQANPVEIKNSINNAEVNAIFKSAGILGYVSKNDFYVTVNNCVNNGEISVVGFFRKGEYFTSLVSGIMNYGWVSGETNTVIVTNNLNKGRINACETKKDGTTNSHSYAAVANSCNHGCNVATHTYNFTNNSNEGTVYYLNVAATDALLVTLNQSYPPYQAANEFNNKTNID